MTSAPVSFPDPALLFSEGECLLPAVKYNDLKGDKSLFSNHLPYLVLEKDKIGKLYIKQFINMGGHGPEISYGCYSYAVVSNHIKHHFIRVDCPITYAQKLSEWASFCLERVVRRKESISFYPPN
jgi:hypothetical protein